MNVMEQARELGKAIQADPRFIRFAKARLANDDNTELQEAIDRFNRIRAQIDEATAAEERDAEQIKSLNEAMRKTYSEIMASSAMVEYNSAKTELDKMVTEVNVIIAKSIEGEDPEICETTSGCAGNCAACGGCH